MSAGPAVADPIYQQIRERDNFRCRICVRQSLRLEVHHIIFRSAGGGEDSSNLILLCRDHHMAAHGTLGPHEIPLAAWKLQFMLDHDLFGMAATERTIKAKPTCRTCEYRRGDWTCAVWDEQACDPWYGCNAWSLRIP